MDNARSALKSTFIFQTHRTGEGWAWDPQPAFIERASFHRCVEGRSVKWKHGFYNKPFSASFFKNIHTAIFGAFHTQSLTLPSAIWKEIKNHLCSAIHKVKNANISSMITIVLYKSDKSVWLLFQPDLIALFLCLTVPGCFFGLPCTVCVA